MSVKQFMLGKDDIKEELDILRKTKDPKIIIKDRGFEALNFRDVEHALGHAYGYLRDEVIVDLITQWAKMVDGKPKIPGFAVVYKGGEFMFRGFHDVYQLIGFLEVNLSKVNKDKMMESIINMPADKFTDRPTLILTGESKDDNRTPDTKPSQKL